MTKKITVNNDCIGCGMCLSIAPEIFIMNKEGLAKVKAGQENQYQKAEQAIQSCPVEAIKCVEEN